ncbi:MAG: MFS transporter [Phormidesmis sp. RL_2_1]|nr:MFS transporter [Phormidesmis sp. RL_2_1]
MFLFSLFLQQVQGYSAVATGLRFLPLNGSFIFASIISGYCSARLGWRCTITVGFTIAAIAVLSLSQVQADTPFEAMVGQLMLVGFGVGLSLSPLTAAAMGTASDDQSGIAAALTNTSTRLGGALGIAVQGGIFTHQMGAHLTQVLTTTGLDAGVRQAIVAEALSHGATQPQRLMLLLKQGSATLSFSELQGLIHQSFISGIQGAMWTGASVLLVAAGLSIAYVRSQPDHSLSSSASTE